MKALVQGSIGAVAGVVFCLLMACIGISTGCVTLGLTIQGYKIF